MTSVMSLGELTDRATPGPSRVDPVLPGSSRPDSGITQHRSTNRESADPVELFEKWHALAEIEATRAESKAEANPRSASLCVLAAFSMLAAGRQDRAVELAIQGLSLCVREPDPAAAYGAGRVLLEAGKLGRASDLLEDLSGDRMVDILRAFVAAESGNYELGLAILESVDGQSATALGGYLYLRLGRLDRAVGLLRAAVRQDGGDVDSLLNLGLALQRSGSDRKALTAVTQAWRLSRSRIDVALAYLDLLWDNEKWELLSRELAELEQSSLADHRTFLFMQARSAIRANRVSRGITLLKHSSASARKDGELAFASEVEGNLLLVRQSVGEITKREAWQGLRDLANGSDRSAGLIAMLARLTDRVSDGMTVERLWSKSSDIESLEATRKEQLAIQVRYIVGDFLGAMQECESWYSRAPSDVPALEAMSAAAGHLDGDWERASKIARRLLKRVPAREFSVNQAAYALALAGHVAEAHHVSELDVPDGYRLLATRGLVRICMGDLQEGFLLYRRAFNVAEKAAQQQGSSDDLVLMSLHQRLLLARLDLSQSDVMVRASALPTMPLPDYWRDSPDFLVLQQRFLREHVSWPETK